MSVSFLFHSSLEETVINHCIVEQMSNVKANLKN